jgi:arsenite/tail-anchored protein-transporting ATPase
VATSTRESQVRYRLIGGKGGVGKTTCAAAQALALAAGGARTLIVSTDPAPSLGDVFQLRLGSEPRRIAAGRATLYAAEIDASLAMRRWLRSRRATLESIAVRGTWLDEKDIGSLLSLAVPGIDEIAALLELIRFGRSGLYDAIVIDAAPTGHTLRMLALPATMAGVARVFDHMQEKHRALVEALRGTWRPDEADRLIDELQSDARDLTALLRDGNRMEVSWVTTAEEMAVEETYDASDWLAAEGIPLRRIVVNKLTPSPAQPCRWCRARRTEESIEVARLVARLRRVYRAAQRPFVVQVMARENEPVGIRELRAIGRELQRAVAATPIRRQRIAATVRGPARKRLTPVQLPFESRTMRLLMFGGKGGVGKTTCAAATALTIAARNEDLSVLLLSTDPAHSLGDVLALPVSDKPRTIPRGPANLQVRQLDPSRALETIRHRYSSSIDALFERIAGGASFDAPYDRRVMHELLDLAPPGLDEVAAVLEVTAMLGETDTRRCDVIVMDTAPTGHVLRLLEMPELVGGWAKAMMTILLKYQPVTGIGDVGSALLQLSKGIGRLRKLMSDPASTNFVVVTRPAELPAAETRRLLAALEALRVHVPAVIVNAMEAGECRRCRRIASREEAQVRSMCKPMRSAGIASVVATPAWMPPPRGLRALLDWRAAWHSGT